MAVAMLATGCAAKAFVRIAPPNAAAPSRAPSLSRAVDLGALPLPAEGVVRADASDSWVTPGEHLALLGDDLGEHPAVTIAGRAAPIVGTLEGGGLLVRLPRGVPPGKQTLTLDNGAGTARLPLQVNSYVWGADARGDALRIRRLSPDESTLDEKALDLEFGKARYTALSPEGGFLFALQEPDYDGAFVPDAIEAVVDAVKELEDDAATCELRVVHLGAKNAPAAVGSLALQLQSRPTGLAAGPNGLVLVLERRHLTVLDASDPTQPKVVARLQVAAADAPRELVDAEFLDGGKKVAVLEAYENRLHLIDVSNAAAPRLIGGLSLADAQEEPFSIDLAPAPGGTGVFVLQGPNLRVAGKKLRDGALKGWSRAKVGFKKAPDEKEEPVATESLARVVEVGLDGETLQLKRALPLPRDVFPFFVAADPKGKLYVSALHGQNPFEHLTAKPEVVLQLLGALKDTAQFSRVIAIDAATGEATTVLQSIAIYYEVVVLPSGRLCASLTRLGPGVLPPRVTLDWGFEIVDGDFVKVREVANTSFKLTQAIARLLPPYRYERIGAQ